MEPLGRVTQQRALSPLTSPSVRYHSLMCWVEPASTQVGPAEQSGHRVGGILGPHLHCALEGGEGLAG